MSPRIDLITLYKRSEERQSSTLMMQGTMMTWTTERTITDKKKSSRSLTNTMKNLFPTSMKSMRKTFTKEKRSQAAIILSVNMTNIMWSTKITSMTINTISMMLSMISQRKSSEAKKIFTAKATKSMILTAQRTFKSRNLTRMTISLTLRRVATKRVRSISAMMQRKNLMTDTSMREKIQEQIVKKDISTPSRQSQAFTLRKISQSRAKSLKE